MFSVYVPPLGDGIKFYFPRADRVSGEMRSRFLRRPKSDLTRYSLLHDVRARRDLKRLKNRLHDGGGMHNSGKRLPQQKGDEREKKEGGGGRRIFPGSCEMK